MTLVVGDSFQRLLAHGLAQFYAVSSHSVQVRVCVMIVSAHQAGPTTCHQAYVIQPGTLKEPSVRERSRAPCKSLQACNIMQCGVGVQGEAGSKRVCVRWGAQAGRGDLPPATLGEILAAINEHPRVRAPFKLFTQCTCVLLHACGMGQASCDSVCQHGIL